MTATLTEVDVSVLASMDEEVQCAHSQHEKDQGYFHDAGPARYWCKVVHVCPARPGTAGSVYPACEAYGKYLIHDAYAWWRCAYCNEITIVCQAVVPLGLIDKDG